MPSTPSLPGTLHTLAAARAARYTEAAVRAGIDPWRMAEGPGLAERVWACSEFVAESCARYPAMLADLLESGDLERCHADGEDGAAQRHCVSRHIERLRASLGESPGEEALRQGLRRMRRREMVRIAWRDIGGLAGLEESMATRPHLPTLCSHTAQTCSIADLPPPSASRRVRKAEGSASSCTRSASSVRKSSTSLPTSICSSPIPKRASA